MGNQLILFQVYERVDDKILTHIHYENVVDDTLPVEDIQFRGWFVRLKNDKEAGIVGEDDSPTYILRVDVIAYPQGDNLRKEDTILNTVDDKLYKIIEDPDYADYLNMKRYTVKRVK
jgi:hypothetical protein